jgi:hypothetical protein
LYDAGVEYNDKRIMSDNKYRKKMMSKLRAELEQKREEKIKKRLKNVTADDIEKLQTSKDYRDYIITKLYMKRDHELCKGRSAMQFYKDASDEDKEHLEYLS